MSDAQVLQRAQDAVSHFCTNFPASGRGVLCVRFYQTVKKSTLFGFGEKLENVLWEHWNVQLRIARDVDAAVDGQRQRSAHELRACIEDILVRSVSVVNLNYFIITIIILKKK